MEKKINIAEILKDCPKGTKLYSPLCGECYFDRLNIGGTIICKKQNTQEITFTSKGYYMLPVFDDCECLLFPSKEQRDWSKFQRPFKDGDILTYTGNYTTIFIYRIKENEPNFSTSFYVGCNDAPTHNFFIYNKYTLIALNENCDVRLATPKEKQQLFDAINENGYKWNDETKTLEKLVESEEDTDDRIVRSGIYFDRENYADEVELRLGNYEIEIRDGKTYAVFKNQKTETLKPKFKVGDKIVDKSGLCTYIVKSVSDEYYGLELPHGIGVMSVTHQDDWELVKDNIKPKFKIGDRLKTKTSKDFYTVTDIRDDDYLMNYGNDKYSYPVSFCNEGNFELVHDKFDISTLKPFDSRVLVRNRNYDIWKASFWGCLIDSEYGFKHDTIRGCYKQCIPYEGNEHLCGKTDECDEFYRTW